MSDALDFLRGDIEQPRATRGAPGANRQPIAGPTRPGAPARTARAQPTYDARPLYAQDFFAPLLTSDKQTDELFAVSFFVNYTVPIGYRAILRAFSFELDPLRTNTTSQIVTTLGVGAPVAFGSDNRPVIAGPVPGFSRMPLGVMSGVRPCWVLAEQGSTISLSITASLAGGVSFNEFFATFYGQLLLANGSPLDLAPFE